MSEGPKPKPTTTTGAALKRGPTLGSKEPSKVRIPNTKRRTTHHGAPAGFHPHVSETESSISASTGAKPHHFQAPVKLENTYRTDPHDGKHFTTRPVDDAVKSILNSYLADVEYDKSKCATLTRDLSQMIKQRVQDMHFERYKLVVAVVIGQNTGQCCELASRSLWNTNTDTFVSVPYKNKTLFAVANIYGVYYE